MTRCGHMERITVMADTNGPVERKTKMATVFTYLVSLGFMGLLNWINRGDLIAGMPDWLEAFIAPLVPATTTFLSGYMTSHRPGALSDSAVAALRGRGTAGGV